MHACLGMDFHHPRPPTLPRRTQPATGRSLSVCFLVAAPLCVLDGDRLMPLPPVDARQELDAVCASLTETGRSVDLRIRPATLDHLRSALVTGCDVLHYAGHCTPEYLSFEDHSGGTHRVSIAALAQLLSSVPRTQLPRLVLLSACASRAAGECMARAGVSHVICAQQDAAVRDTACAGFSAALYQALVTGSTIQAAFELARSSVAADSDSVNAHQFLLLPMAAAETAHEVALLGPPGAARGAIRVNRAPEPPLPLPCTLFGGRTLDVYRAVSTLRVERLLCITGAPGIGKTSVAISTARYLAERTHFPDGVFLVRLTGASSAENVRATVSAALGLYSTSTESVRVLLSP